jgi:hypothetical protein
VVLAPLVERILTSTRFLVSTAVCCGLSVALAIWAAGGAGGGARVLAGLIGLTASLAVMLLIAAAASDGAPPPPAAAPAVEAAAPAPAPPRVSEGRDVLARYLDEGRALREELQPGSADPRVDSWIDEVKAAIEGWRPGVAGYFNALAQRTYADDGLRLDAYTRRLETIVRDY